MAKLIIILGFVLVTIVYSCKQANSDKNDIDTSQSKHQINYDTSGIVILDFKTAQDILPQNAQPSQLHQNDFYSIDYLLKEPIEYVNIGLSQMFEDYRMDSPKDHPPKNWFVIDLSRFKRQYIPFKNEHGEKEVLVIGYRPDTVPHGDDSVWKQKPFPSNYGGHHAFRVRINLSKSSHSDIQLNGYG